MIKPTLRWGDVSSLYVVLQGGGAVLQGDVPELGVLLHAKVPDHVGVLVGFAQEVNLTIRDAGKHREKRLNLAGFFD